MVAITRLTLLLQQENKYKNNDTLNRSRSNCIKAFVSVYPRSYYIHSVHYVIRRSDVICIKSNKCCKTCEFTPCKTIASWHPTLSSNHQNALLNIQSNWNIWLVCLYLSELYFYKTLKFIPLVSIFSFVPQFHCDWSGLHIDLSGPHMKGKLHLKHKWSSMRTFFSTKIREFVRPRKWWYIPVLLLTDLLTTLWSGDNIGALWYSHRPLLTTCVIQIMSSCSIQSGWIN